MTDIVEDLKGLTGEECPCGMCDIINAGVSEIQKLRAQLPEGMKHCTILVKQCEVGHSWLTATNWVQFGCPTCEREMLTERLRKVEEMAMRGGWRP